MSFRFDFGDDGPTGEAGDARAEAGERRHALPAHFVHAAAGAGPLPVQGETIACAPGAVLFKRSVSDVKFELAATEAVDAAPSNELAQSIEQQSDLIRGVYEGGLKTWECSVDLVAYLAQAFGARRMDGLRVMELGCGSALPGIYALTLGASVDFQDYNEPVVHMVTIPNVLLNTANRPSPEILSPEGLFETEVVVSDSLAASRFIAGDWSGIPDLLARENALHQYDIVLTSESIYDAETLPDLFALIKALAKPGGIALVAAKAIYFGCTGSLNDFVRLAGRDGSCRIETVHVNAQTVRREIVQLSF
ncbi:hypothetical protein HK105_204041 [Polyrhizophydium stewartii]|uniref:protein-histidine N-methyltransferase n=1 Tax=Polyrhizophydium stewartii TaxID=2732419 RepID=A0ABR4N9R6_9FUNG|nr:hypothetical protein HK105_001197 [Polyrhizophydium stewartii]